MRYCTAILVTLLFTTLARGDQTADAIYRTVQKQTARLSQNVQDKNAIVRTKKVINDQMTQYRVNGNVYVATVAARKEAQVRVIASDFDIFVAAINGRIIATQMVEY